MERFLHPRIIGACVVGCALVAGAYVLSTFGQSTWKSQPAAVVTSPTARVAIAVTDADDNGIEDWRDEFITTEPLIIPAADSSYELPTTLTGQFGIDFIERYVRAQSYGPFGQEQDQVVEEAISVLTQQSVYKLYDTADITIMNTWVEADIRTYANTVALALSNNDLGSIESELDIIARAVKKAEPDRAAMAQLQQIADAYSRMRDQTAATPVPTIFAKQHLDLINTYHALNEGIGSMAGTLEDPALALVRLKRYQDDVLGLKLALQNMYLGLEPYASLVGPSDPALLFVMFSPDYNS